MYIIININRLDAVQYSQQSVRELAVKSMSIYINRTSKSKTAQNLILLLTNTKINPIVNDPFKAEGLIELLISLMRYVTSNFIIDHYTLFWDNFSVYLSHEASTVRQAVSSCIYKLYYLVFLTLAVKDSNPELFLLFMDLLTNYWNNTEETDENKIWQKKEGLYLVYELVFKYLLKVHGKELNKEKFNMYKSPQKIDRKSTPASEKVNKLIERKNSLFSEDKLSTKDVV